MFTYIKLKNYKSLVNFSADFTNGKKTPKKLVLIYGENGIGKSNLASAFYTLYETTKTKYARAILDTYIQQKNQADKGFEYFLRENFIKNNFKDTQALIAANKTIGSKGNMLLEFGFKLNGKNGVYKLETNNENLVAESLEYDLGGSKKLSFNFKESNKKLELDDNFFKDVTYKKEIEDLLEKYWGKHSLFAILSFENQDKKGGYVQKRLAVKFYNILKYFTSLTIRLNGNHGVEKGTLYTSVDLLSQLDSGLIKNPKIDELKRVETFLNEFFTYYYSDIKQVYFKKENDSNNYKLMFKKLIYNELIDVEFNMESAGTKALVELIPFYISCIEGRTTIIDEMDTGIHDVLIKAVLEGLNEAIRGQMIIATHNTMLLESDSLKNHAYIFNSNKDGKKELIPITDFERPHPNLNMRKRYLSGQYGGVPSPMEADFEEMLEVLKED